MNLNIENNLFKFLHKSHISHPVQKNAFLWTKTIYDDPQYMLTFDICRWRTTHLPSGSKTPNAFSPTSEPSQLIKICHHQTKHQAAEVVSFKPNTLQRCSFQTVFSSAMLCSNIAPSPVTAFRFFIRESKLLEKLKMCCNLYFWGE